MQARTAPEMEKPKTIYCPVHHLTMIMTAEN